MPTDDSAPYLRPYLDAARSHGDGFRSLLWASPRTQVVRFEALTRIVDFRGRLVCDAGCGRADLLDHLDRAGIPVADYTGIEAVPELAAAAERKVRPGVRIRRGDFIREPVRLFVGAEVLAFSGSLNTADDAAFYDTVRRAFDATAWALVFNFLSTPELAGASHLHWRPRRDVERFARTLSPVEVRVLDDYLDGDCTMAILKEDPHG
jgi:SAM-dependent methyltransferase